MAFGDFTVVRAGTKWVLNSSGVLSEVAANVPAFEFNVDGTYRGLCVESAATNLLTYSQQFDNAAWTKTNASITANATTAPDGTATADKLVEDGTTNVHLVQQALAVTEAPYSFSVYLKAGERTWGGLRGVNSAAANVRAWFNLSTGAVGTVDAGGTGHIRDMGDGWYRCTLTLALGSTSAFEWRVFTATGDGVDSYLGDGTSGIFVWQSQLETGLIATSPITTTTASANRIADVISLSSASSLIGQSEGTLYCEAEVISTTSDAIRFALIADNGTENDSVALRLNTDGNAQFVVFDGGVAQAVITSAGTVSGVFKFAGAYAADDFALYLNGSSVGTDTGGTIPAMANIRLGSDGTIRQFMGWIRSVATFPTRLSNAQLASLTT